MSRERQSRTKLNNQGMSLVEVLVAMIIISIAGVAFLQSFTYATKYNILSREKQHAMGLAQSIMEDFKAYSLEDMDGKFSGSSFDHGLIYVEFISFRGFNNAIQYCTCLCTMNGIYQLPVFLSNTKRPDCLLGQVIVQWYLWIAEKDP